MNETASSDPEFESLHPRALWLLRIRLWLSLGLPALPLGLFGSRMLAVATGLPTSAMLAWLLPLLLFAVAGFGWRHGRQRYQATRYRLDAEGIELQRGVWWRSETRVPHARVQHTDLERGPLDRRLGLASLVVHTAGTETAALRISGLDEARARALRDALLRGHDARL